MIFFLVSVQALQRHLPFDGWPWTGELATFCLVWLTYVGAGVLVTSDSHISIELIDVVPNALLRHVVRVVSCLIVAASRALDLSAPRVYRRTHAHERDLAAFRAPDGTEMFLGDTAEDEPAWVREFEDAERNGDASLLTDIDHVNLTQSWQNFDEAVLFYSSVLALDSEPTQEVAAPTGLVRSHVVRSRDGAVRLALNVAPSAFDHPYGFPQHVAFSSTDAVAAARAARKRGLRLLPIAANYYDDLRARYDLPADFVRELHDLGVMYDQSGDGEFLHFYTETIGKVFFEVVQRIGGYQGYGAANAPVRLAAQHHPHDAAKPCWSP